ncbi:MAG: hypothetical protein K6G40_05345 [Eubacterium sp.]|nr:hypothetical protein [Eubacterium sp.]
MRKKVLVLIILVITFIIAYIVFAQRGDKDIGKVTGINNEYFESWGDEFELVEDESGTISFKDPDAAFEKMVELCGEGLAQIQKEYELDEISKADYEAYKVYGWQLTGGTDEAKKQAAFVSSFLDIYENK